MGMKELVCNFSADDENFIKDMNELSSEAQRKLLLKKAKEFCWGIYENTADKKDIKNRNFHVIVNDDLNRDLRLQRVEYMDYLRRKIIRYSLWNKQHRIEGQYGELVYQLIKLIKVGE